MAKQHGLRHYLTRWKKSKNYKHDLDQLLEQAQPDSPLQERLLWSVHLTEWIRYQASNQDYSEIKNVKIPATRIRFLLMVLDRNPQWKSNVAKTLRSIVREVSALDLFSEIGLPQEVGFWGELKNRLFMKIMPEKPLSEGMGNLFSAMFPSHNDTQWLNSLDPQVLASMIQLFHHDIGEEEKNWNSLRNDIEEAILCLVSEVRAIGLSPSLRKRMGAKNIKDIPFFKLTSDLDEIIFAYKGGKTDEFIFRCKECRKLIWNCVGTLRDVYKHLDEFGVNVAIVYNLESANAKLKRIDDLILFLMMQELDPEILLYFIIQLVQENQERKSLLALFDQDTRLLARKIVDRSAETGEHYFARNIKEYKKMFARAAGGGFYTAFTVYIKFFILTLKTALFIEGFLASINYAICFLGIYASGFTLATKQPAMTGPVLASKMQNIDTGESIEPLINEIVFLLRTQVVGILGNALSVVPVVVILDLIFYFSTGHKHLISLERANYVLESTSFLGWTPLYAAFTGVLLWGSAVFAGWMDNWFVFNDMKSTIKYNRRLNFIFGRDICASIASFFERNVSGISANTSLGFLMGLAPQLTKFLGLNLAVRHVTLQSGFVGAAMAVYGFKVFEMKTFWFAVIGMVFVAILNVSVSFLLAFWVALRSRDIRASQRRHIYQAIWLRFKKKPTSFFYPSKGADDLNVSNADANKSGS